MKRANVIRGLIILAITAFFGYQYMELGHSIYLVYLVGFGFTAC